jgi:protein-S-isoprenylcysteine O-methyltransferase Ste14
MKEEKEEGIARDILKKEGVAKDLAEKLRKGEITSGEAKREIRKRGFGHEETWKDFIPFVVWGILCFLPAIARGTGLGFLSFFAQLPAIEIPTIVIYLSIALFIVMIPFTAWGIYFNSRKGGCHHPDHTVIFLKSGPYGIVRHPNGVAWTVFFATAPIILSRAVSFTILSVIAIVAIIALSYYGNVDEEKKLNIPKWGDEYRQYMKEVPRFNLILGIWRLLVKKTRRND